MENEKILVEKMSAFSVEETVSMIIAAAAKQNWQNPATHNLQQSVAKSGKEIRPVQVVELCKPDYSGAMLEKNDERIISVLMPCRVSVYQKNDGKTYVAYLNVIPLLPQMPTTVANVMLAANNEIQDILNF
jgi:uncharacterized protein (DUF302 family)